jgi:DNA-binding NtrC family response regulator/tetratricopeptide (TPR) repeat protein
MVGAMDPLDGVLGASAGIERLRRTVRELIRRQGGLRRQPPLLIVGETGTGKGLLARALHRAGPRAAAPFVDVNCAAIPENLLEAEMFGYERGAFTDARQAKPGLFQTATRGTLFLDEVGLLAPGLQAKLLKVLEEGAVRRLGSTRSEAVDVAVIAATNEDIAEAVAQGRFREDLYHRLAVLVLSLPPLRDRGDDVLLLADGFLARACADYGLPAKTFDREAQAALRSYRWPGNIRELSNVVERVALTSDGPLVTAAMLGLPFDRPARTSVDLDAPSADDIARQELIAALEKTGWNISRTAALLEVTRNTVRARIARFGIAPVDERRARGVTKPSAAAPAADPVSDAEAAAVAEAATVADDTSPGFAPAKLRWERRPVAVLRVAFTPPDDHRPISTTGLIDSVIDKITTFGGVVDALTPRSVGAAFGIDVPEDAPRRAAHAALAIHTYLSRARADAVSLAAESWNLAIHAGVFSVARGGDVRTIDADVRAEVQAVLVRLVEGGQQAITVSGQAAGFLRRHFDLVPADATSPGAFRLVSPGKAVSPIIRSTAFIGRRAELALLESLFQSAAGGSGAAVLVTGEAGLGKSRLIGTLRDTLAGRAATFLEGRCLPLTVPVPYLPLLGVIRQALGVIEGTPQELVPDAVRAAMADLGIDDDESIGCLARLLGADSGQGALAYLAPDVVKTLTFETVRRLLVTLSRREVVVLTIEDAHWADGPSNELLGYLVDAVGNAPILLTATARPGHVAAWMERSDVTRLALQPLSASESRLLVDSVADRSLDTQITQAIVARGEGNPFFLEELTRAVQEAPSSSLRDIPETIHQVLVGRMDRLDAEARHTVQAAAVIGRDIALPVLSAVMDAPPATVTAAVNRLRAAQLVVDSATGGPAAWAFKHALVHDVCYRSVHEDERHQLHGRVVDAFSRVYPDRLGAEAEWLAEHALGAQRWDEAAAFLHQAGTNATLLGAYTTAATCFQRAISALDHLPSSRATAERAIDERLALRGALLPLGEFGRIVECLQQAADIAEALGGSDRLAKIYAYLTDYFRQIGDAPRALETGHRALEAAKRDGHVAAEVAARIYLSHVYYDSGSYGAAADLLRGLLELTEGMPVDHRYGLPYIVAVHARNWLALYLAELGERSEAVAVGDRALEIARALDDPPSIASALTFLGRVHFRTGDVDTALEAFVPCLEMLRRLRLRLLLPMAAEAFGLARVRKGELAEGIALLEEAAEIHRTMRGTAALSMRLAALSLGYHAAGDDDRARRVGEQALALARRHGERGHEAYALHAIAESSPGPSAERRAAADLAAALGMRPLLDLCNAASEG